MQSVKELKRHPSPGGKPQPLAALGGLLYVGSLETSTIYGIEPGAWEVRSEIASPGKPYGMAVLGGTIRVVVSIGEADDRYLYTFVPGKGFDESSKMALPELTGSHLASDGTSLYLLQIGKRKIVTLDAVGAVAKETALPQRIAGVGVAGGRLYGLAGDEEFEHLHLATIDLAGAQAVVTDVASISDEARALTHDGNVWWTSYRDENQIGSFAV
ncbi:MAG TPA: hypothetical protein VIJ12_08640 [Candidatus Baltobacteraceae bacterium]